MRLLFLILCFVLWHWLYIALGLIIFYSSGKYKIRSFGWRLVAHGLAPNFGHPKQLCIWLDDHCSYNPTPKQYKRCTYWTCSKYGKCVYSHKEEYQKKIRGDFMKNKKILSIFLVVIVITTLFVPLFSFGVSAVEVPEYQANKLTFVLESELPAEYYIEIRGVDGSIVFDSTYEVGTVIRLDYLLINPFVVTEEEEYYEIGEEYYEIVYHGRDWSYPYLDFYNLGGDRIHGLHLDQDDSEHIYMNYTDTCFISLSTTDKDLEYPFVTYVRRITIENAPTIDDAYRDGYYEGYQSAREYYLPQLDDKFQEGYQSAREYYLPQLDDKFQEGYDAGVSSGFGNNLLGDTLSAPAKALNNFLLYVSPNGYVITIWGVLSTIIGVSLFIWFMKMFAGG